MVWYNLFKKKEVEVKATESDKNAIPSQEGERSMIAYGNKTQDTSIFKAYIPQFLYKPPYGYPRKVNTVYLKSLAKNPYIFSVIKTLCDEVVSKKWEIKVLIFLVLEYYFLLEFRLFFLELHQ